VGWVTLGSQGESYQRDMLLGEGCLGGSGSWDPDASHNCGGYGLIVGIDLGWRVDRQAEDDERRPVCRERGLAEGLVAFVSCFCHAACIDGAFVDLFPSEGGSQVSAPKPKCRRPACGEIRGHNGLVSWGAWGSTSNLLWLWWL